MKYKLVFMLIVLLFGVFLSYLLSNGAKGFINSKLNNFDLLPREKKYTELYFDDIFIFNSNKTTGMNIDSSFTIHNFEGEDKEYEYLMYYAPENGDIEMLDSNTVFIRNNEEMSIKKNIYFVNNGKKGKVYIELPKLGQKINFIIDKSS